VLSRRQFLTSFAAFAGLAAAAPRALAQSIAGDPTSISPKVAISGKLATRTENVFDRREPAMLTTSSPMALAGAIAAYEEIAAAGGWPEVPKAKLAKGARNPNVVLLRQRLVRENYLPFDALNIDTPEVYDADVVEAVRAFQASHGIAPSGNVDERTRAELNISAAARLFTLRENQPRIVTYLEGLGRRAILVNIPSAQLEAVQDGIVFARHNVVCGKLERPTPSLMSTVSDVNFNPYWKAPASIVERDIIPKYLKDPNYLDEMNIHVFDGIDGPEIDPATVDWANTPPDRFFFRQEQGDNNALGTVKINFPNKFMVYMHDTPHREDFGGNARYQSSGCVRVDKVRALVEWVLNGQDGYTDATFEMITASQESYVTQVQDPPDVRFMYLTAWAMEDGTVNFRPDIYSLDGTGFILGQPDPALQATSGL
jgi:murein L,D-transpeptidase YcbB/YkuD